MKKKNVVTIAADWIAPIILVLLVPIFATRYVSDHNTRVRAYDASVAACERGNVLRVRINTKFEVYNTAFEEAAKALANSTTPIGKRLRDVLHAAAVTQPDPVPLTPCLDVYEKPRWFWQREEEKNPSGPTGIAP